MFDSSKFVAFTATSKGAEARVFYEETLGLELVSDDDFAIVFNVDGLVLRVQKVKDHSPPPYTTLGWSVADIEASVRRLSSKGVRFERFGGMEQDEQGVWPSPSGARVAWFKDPDGNTISLTQLP